MSRRRDPDDLQRARPFLLTGACFAVLAVTIVGFAIRSTLAETQVALIASTLTITAAVFTLLAGLYQAARTRDLTARQLAQQAEQIRMQREQIDDQRASAELDRARAVRRDLRERFARATEQLGAPRAPTRLGGAHGLAVLADEWMALGDVTAAQLAVDVLCAQLRLPPRQGDSGDREVRSTIVGLLAEHVGWTGGVRPPRAGGHWSSLNLDLRQAQLPGCDFTGATFHGRLDLRGAVFEGQADLSGVTFTQPISFARTEFGGFADFTDARFTQLVLFTGTQFAAGACFRRVQFRRSAKWEHVAFATALAPSEQRPPWREWAIFTDASFGSDAVFTDLSCPTVLAFTRASFTNLTMRRNRIRWFDTEDMTVSGRREIEAGAPVDLREGSDVVD